MCGFRCVGSWAAGWCSLIKIYDFSPSPSLDRSWYWRNAGRTRRHRLICLLLCCMITTRINFGVLQVGGVRRFSSQVDASPAKQSSRAVAEIEVFRCAGLWLVSRRKMIRCRLSLSRSSASLFYRTMLASRERHFYIC